jgi:ribonuclease III
MQTSSLDRFQSRLGYSFREPALLQRALRHRSAGKDNNERLEFLGDAVLGFVISSHLHKCLPEASEGELSRLRAELVQQNTLAGIARELQLGEFLILGPGEIRSGGAARDSILADALEALISALYLDGGLELCTALISRWFGGRLYAPDQLRPGKDAKTRLQELLQARHQSLPIYEVLTISGRDHQQLFTVACTVPGLGAALQGQGPNRKVAEQQAALEALRLLEGPTGETGE